VVGLKQVVRYGFEKVEDWFDAIFGPDWNPFFHLGALGWFFYWIVAVSGLYLYIFFDTGVVQAYESVEALTHSQWYAGGVMRSLHRYASDALVVVMLMHLLREFALDRFRGHRWFAWLTGIPLLWFVYACGVSGYWLVWDKLAQYIAIATSEWLDSLPLFGKAVAHNFVNSAGLGGRFFTLMVFIHIAVPLITLFLMWIHIQRHAQAKVNPPRGLAAGTLGMLVVLSLVYPAVSQGPANLDQVPASVNLDWFYLAGYPLLDVIGGAQLWMMLIGMTVVLLLLPWLPPQRPQTVAVVDLDNCNGCGWCAADCPFSAISMQQRSDGLPFDQEAVVDSQLCMSCGICAGACPTSTPFRRLKPISPGIQLPEETIAKLRERTVEAAADLSGEGRILVFGCGHGVELDHLKQPSVATVQMPCVAMLPPSFVDFVIARHYADGVFIAGCRSGDCHYRLGDEWMEQRFAGKRDPYLRKRVPRERVVLSWAGPTQAKRCARELDEFRIRLRALEPPQGPIQDARHQRRGI